MESLSIAIVAVLLFLLKSVAQLCVQVRTYEIFDSHSVFTAQHFECQLPQPLVSLEAFIDDKEEYPSVCYGIKIL